MVIHVIQACILVIADLPPLVNEFHFLNMLLSVWRFILSLPGTGLIQRPEKPVCKPDRHSREYANSPLRPWTKVLEDRGLKDLGQLE